MKLSVGLFCFAIAASSGAADGQGMSIRGSTKSASKLMQQARLLQNNNYYNGQYGGGQYGGGQYGGGQYGGGQYGGGYYNNGGQQDNAFVYSYSLKLLTCTQGETAMTNYQDGKVESSTVVFRLCPIQSCDDETSAFGCEEGYGDYAVGINTFVEAYIESQRDSYTSDMQVYNKYGTEFNVEEYRECREFKAEEQNDGNNYNYGDGNSYNNQQVYIGPACTADGTSIRLGLFYDQYCSYESDVEFGSLVYGWDSLPYGNGGLVPNKCISCVNYNWELSEMCTKNYESASARCEQNMQSHSYYGANNYGCDYIDTLVSAVDLGSSTVAQGGNIQSQAQALNSQFRQNLHMDEETEIEIALFVVMSILGAVLACCIASCVRCRKVPRKLKLGNRSYDVDQPVIEVPDGPEMKRRMSSIVQMVRSSTNTMKDATIAAALTAQLVMADAASKTVTAVKRARSNVSKTAEDTAIDESPVAVDEASKAEYTALDEDTIMVHSPIEKAASTKSVASAKSVASKKSVASTKSVGPPVAVEGASKAEYTAMGEDPPIMVNSSFKESASTKRAVSFESSESDEPSGDNGAKSPLIITGSYRAPSPADSDESQPVIVSAEDAIESKAASSSWFPW